MRSHQYDLEDQHIRRTLMRFRYDREFRGDDGRVPIRSFAAFIGLTAQWLYCIMDPELSFSLRPSTRARIMHGIDLVLNRGLRWKRGHRIWRPILPDGSLPTPPPPPIARRKNHGHSHLQLP